MNTNLQFNEIGPIYVILDGMIGAIIERSQTMHFLDKRDF